MRIPWNKLDGDDLLQALDREIRDCLTARNWAFETEPDVSATQVDETGLFIMWLLDDEANGITLHAEGGEVELTTRYFLTGADIDRCVTDLCDLADAYRAGFRYGKASTATP